MKTSRAAKRLLKVRAVAIWLAVAAVAGLEVQLASHWDYGMGACASTGNQPVLVVPGDGWGVIGGIR